MAFPGQCVTASSRSSTAHHAGAAPDVRDRRRSGRVPACSETLRGECLSPKWVPAVSACVPAPTSTQMVRAQGVPEHRHLQILMFDSAELSNPLGYGICRV